jgi:hypothetical protein
MAALSKTKTRVLANAATPSENTVLDLVVLVVEIQPIEFEEEDDIQTNAKAGSWIASPPFFWRAWCSAEGGSASGGRFGCPQPIAFAGFHEGQCWGQRTLDR